MSNALQYKASKGFRYIHYICRWCWRGGGGGNRHNFWEIWRGVRANLRLSRGGYCVIFLLARLVFRPPPPPPLLIIIAQSLILKNLIQRSVLFRVVLGAKNRPFGIWHQSNGLLTWKSGIIVVLLGCDKWHTDQSAL